MEEKEEEREEEEEEGKEEEEEVKMVDSVGVGEKGGCLSFPRNMCVSRKGADANFLSYFLCNLQDSINYKICHSCN